MVKLHNNKKQSLYLYSLSYIFLPWFTYTLRLHAMKMISTFSFDWFFCIGINDPLNTLQVISGRYMLVTDGLITTIYSVVWLKYHIHRTHSSMISCPLFGQRVNHFYLRHWMWSFVSRCISVGMYVCMFVFKITQKVLLYKMCLDAYVYTLVVVRGL